MNLFISSTPKGKKQYPIHKHHEFEISIYPYSAGILHTLKRDYTFNEGSIVLIPPETAHGTESDTDIEGIYIRGNFNQLIHISEPVILKDNLQKEANKLAMLIYENRFGNKDYLSSLCNALIHFIAINIKYEDDISKAVTKIISKITNQALYSNINLTDILKSSGYAEDYIRAQFKKITEKTPVEFLTHIRISHARFLIETYGTHLSLSQIAEKCGYSNYVYFSRRFKQIMGMSPRKFIQETLYLN